MRVYRTYYCSWVTVALLLLQDSHAVFTIEEYRKGLPMSLQRRMIERRGAVAITEHLETQSTRKPRLRGLTHAARRDANCFARPA